MITEQCDVLIIGAGPTGLAAALELKRLGVTSVIVVDREAEVGGMPRLCHHTGFGLRDLHRLYSGPAYARAYARRVETAGIEVRPSTTVTGWASPTTLNLTSLVGLGQIQARAVLLATGCRERPRSARLVPGSRPQGIFTTGSLQRFIYQYQQPVGRRAVVVGAELVSLSALMTLAHAHISTVAMVTEFLQHQFYFPYTAFKWYIADLTSRTPIIRHVRVSRIVGRQRVEGVELTRLDSGQKETIPCDTIIFSGDWRPENELARLGNLAINPATHGPQIDTGLRTSARGVFAAGNVLRGAETADIAALEGRHAALSIKDFLERGEWPERLLPIQVEAPVAWVSPNAVPTSRHRGQAKPLAGHFTFRVNDFCPKAQVQIRQGQKILHEQTFRRLMPNKPFYVNQAWLVAVEPEGEALQLVMAK
jgi:thioredoxin reductase